jgi:hypothetical protein
MFQTGHPEPVSGSHPKDKNEMLNQVEHDNHRILMSVRDKFSELTL